MALEQGSSRESVAMCDFSLDHRRASNNNFGVKGDWRTAHEIADLELEACPGDRLEFRRDGRHFAGYGHWGIYVGRKVNKTHDHQVIHFGIFQKGAKFSKKKFFGLGFFARRKPEILVSSIDEILGSDQVRINNVRDRSWPPLETDEIIAEALDQLEDQTYFPPVYHVFRYNCEHFVNLCRYGRSHSDQAEDYVKSNPLLKWFIGT